MRFAISYLLAALLALTTFGQSRPTDSEATALYREAVAAYEARDYVRSIEFCHQSLAKGARRGTVPYHLACCYALTGKPNDAFKYLNLAIERGWTNAAHLSADPDLSNLHADPRWPAAVTACATARDEALRGVKEPALAKELLDRMALDQKARLALEAKFKALPPGESSVKVSNMPPELDLHQIDTDNTTFMKTVILKHGWPGKSLVGDEAANAAWLLVQHADLDRAFQSRCLELIKQAFDKGDATGAQLAYLTDRVLVGQGKKQKYGTQFRGIGENLEPVPIEDEANVDERRRTLGLPPLAEYAKMLRGG